MTNTYVMLYTLVNNNTIPYVRGRNGCRILVSGIGIAHLLPSSPMFLSLLTLKIIE